jgi:hypothetical protein
MISLNVAPASCGGQFCGEGDDFRLHGRCPTLRRAKTLPLGIASWCRTVRNEPTEALPIAGHQSVDRVDNWRQPQPP